MLSAKKLTEGVTIMCIFLVSARAGGLATPSEGPGATVGARARGKETAYTLINIYGGGRHRRRHNTGTEEGVTEIYQLFLRYIIFFPLICNIILKHYHYGKS